jgi:hypothetical protein
MKTYEQRLNEITTSLLTESNDDNFTPANYGDELSQISSHKIPATNKIGSTLFGNFRIKTFHITDVQGIRRIKSIVKQKKALSSFTFMSSSNLKTMSGVRTKGGVLFEMEGKTLYVGNYNLVNYPDNRGKRWLDINTVIPSSLTREYGEMVHNYIANNTPSGGLQYYSKNEKKPLNVIKYIAGYILLVEDFISKNKEALRKHAIGARLSSSHNEILVHDIIVKDVLWTTVYTDWVGTFKRLRDKPSYDLTPNEKQYKLDCLNKIDEIENELMEGDWVTGDIIHTDDTTKALQWVVNRGGNIDFEEFKKKMENNQYS